MYEHVVIFPHNKLAYEKACAAFETSNRTCVIQPTGTGKMYIAMQLMDDHPNEETLYLSSYNPILSALDAEMKKCGVISKRLTPALYAGLNDALCAKKYDYIIMDEFHRAGAEVWGAWVAKLLENNPQAKVLGLSATPIRYLDNNRDMSDELFDGNVASSMTLAEAVGAGILKMPKYICAVYSLSEELERYKERVGKMKSDANKTEALMLLEKARRSLEQADGLPKIFANNMTVKDGRYIVFCRNYEHMESMETECQGWLRDVNTEIAMYELRSSRQDALNEQTLADFDADNSPKLKLLFVVDMLNEGVHLKNVDGCIMLRPTESMNVFLQQLGRAISVSSKAQTVIFDIVNNSAQLNAFGSFKSDVERAAKEAGSGVELDDFEINEKLSEFWDIVSQIDILLSNKTWDEWFALAQKYFQKHENLLTPVYYKTCSGEKLGVWIRCQREAYKNQVLSFERQKKLETIGMIWDVLDAKWEKMFACAREYYQKNGHLKVHQKFKTTVGDKLGQWISIQREAYKKGNLSIERQKRLEAIGMIWNTIDEIWEEMFAYALEYFRKNGNLIVPKQYKIASGNNLNSWICEQRKNYKNGKLSKERQKRLEAIGMIWRPKDAAWEEMFNYAWEYFRKYGNLNLTCEYVTTSNKHLGSWICHQRTAYKNDKLSAEQQKRLESIGMVWNVVDDAWEKMFSFAEKYFKENGDLLVLNRFSVAAGKNLGAWIANQRTAYKNGKLSEEKQKKLEAIGMIWDVNTAAWEEMFASAENYFKEHGHLIVPSAFSNTSSKSLGAWIGTQRTAYKKGTLSVERKKRLETIGMVWDVHDVKWEEMFICAQTYFLEYGSLKVPYRYITASGKPLGAWIGTQRGNYKNEKLSTERQKRLEAIGMIWEI